MGKFLEFRWWMDIHNEKWMRELDGFLRLKLRASLGSTGSQGSNAYQSLATYNYSD